MSDYDEPRRYRSVSPYSGAIVNRVTVTHMLAGAHSGPRPR
jgi:hypothetical protein